MFFLTGTAFHFFFPYILQGFTDSLLQKVCWLPACSRLAPPVALLSPPVLSHVCGSQSHLQKVTVTEAVSLEVGSLLSPGMLRALCWDPSVALGIETSKTESGNMVEMLSIFMGNTPSWADLRIPIWKHPERPKGEPARMWSSVWLGLACGGPALGGIQCSSSLLGWPQASYTPSPALRHQSHLFLKQKQPSEQKEGSQ